MLFSDLRNAIVDSYLGGAQLPALFCRKLE